MEGGRENGKEGGKEKGRDGGKGKGREARGTGEVGKRSK